jgi:hypothetical protein
MEKCSIAAAARTPRDKSRFQIILRILLLSCFEKRLSSDMDQGSATNILTAVTPRYFVQKTFCLCRNPGKVKGNTVPK